MSETESLKALVKALQGQVVELQKRVATCPVLVGEIGAWICQNDDPEKALRENDELRRQNAALVEALTLVQSAFRSQFTDNMEAIVKQALAAKDL